MIEDTNCQNVILENEYLLWQFSRTGDNLQTALLHNKLTSRDFHLQDVTELTLVLSGAVDRVQEPLLRVEDFQVISIDQIDNSNLLVQMQSASTGLNAVLNYTLDGSTRRKWVEITNASQQDILLLDIELDSFNINAPVSDGGAGTPLFITEEIFAAVEYPSGENSINDGHVKLVHFPGNVLTPGSSYISHTALLSVTKAGNALEHFVSYIDAHSRRQKHVLSIFTPFGINNQWGICPTLDDEETLHILALLGSWRDKCVHFDYFTLDTGWMDPGSDMTRFRPNAYPDGPEKVVRRIGEVEMKFGLWFASSWAAESCWDNPDAWPGQQVPAMKYFGGCLDKARYASFFCYGYKPYADMLREAIKHHIRENNIKFIKLDGGQYGCDNTEHGHLPGKYSTERMYDYLVEIADAAREAAPDIFVMWYWGLRSPFWALYGDSIFESGLHMEGSGTSSIPTLYYRDSVTLAQDQNAQFAKLIPPMVKDSLGVWLADTRWGNFMGKERWREAMVMDLGRGSLLFPNIWGNLYLLDDEDVEFLAWISNLAKCHEDLFMQRRIILGDPWKSEVYGYAHCLKERGYLFINNPNFVSHKVEIKLDGSIGLEAEAGTALRITSKFPEAQTLLQEDGSPYRMGDTVSLWVRPFEVLMLKITSVMHDITLPVRSLSQAEAMDLGSCLSLDNVSADPTLAIRFMEEERFAEQDFVCKEQFFNVELPALDGPQPFLAVAIRLRDGAEEWRYSPSVAEIAQVRASIGDTNFQLMPVPDARQFGNTQNAGCSWVVYKVRLSSHLSGQTLRLAVSAWLPPQVEAKVEAWIVKRWWNEDRRPVSDGYYAYAPS